MALRSGTVMHGFKLPFCSKFNRRYFGEDIFDRLVMIAASYRTDFEHKTQIEKQHNIQF